MHRQNGDSCGFNKWKGPSCKVLLCFVPQCGMIQRQHLKCSPYSGHNNKSKASARSKRRSHLSSLLNNHIEGTSYTILLHRSIANICSCMPMLTDRLQIHFMVVLGALQILNVSDLGQLSNTLFFQEGYSAISLLKAGHPSICRFQNLIIKILGC